MRTFLVAAALLVALPAAAGKPGKGAPAKQAAVQPIGKSTVTDTPLDIATRDEPRAVAEAYLKALAGDGDEKGRDTLLGGATLTAKIFTLANWKLAARDPQRVEKGELTEVHANVDALDREGRAALGRIMGGGPAGKDLKEDELQVEELTAEDAKQILDPTRARAAGFLKSHPVFAYVARVDKEVYWHPKNPVRKLLADAGAKGPYTLQLNLFWVETSEGLGTKTIRRWPLRIVRLQAGAFDTGFKVLPASDWNAE